MDLDLLGYNLTGSQLYVNNRNSKIQLAMLGLPYGLLVNAVIAMPSVSESIYYYHNDHLGTPQVLTDDQGQIAWKSDYKPFGEVDIVVETVENNFRFPGQCFDEETGLHYNYYRDYDLGIGRYLTPDPIGLNGGINPYTYVLNNPINLVDPDGLQFKFPRWWPWLSAARAACSLYCFARAIHCHIVCDRDASADPCQNGSSSRFKKCSECVKDYMKCMDICNPAWRDKIKIPRLPGGPGSGGGGAGRVFLDFPDIA